jgi:hypothetical protein
VVSPPPPDGGGVTTPPLLLLPPPPQAERKIIAAMKAITLRRFSISRSPVFNVASSNAEERNHTFAISQAAF